MKLSKLILSVLMVGALLSSGVATAQTRKKSSRAKATTHKAAPARKTPSKRAAASISADQLIGKTFLMLMEAGQFEMSIKVGEITINENNSFSAKMFGSTVDGTWTLNGSNIKFTAAAGKTLFTGQVVSPERMTGVMNGQKSVLYSMTAPENPRSVEEVKKSLLKGEYTTFLALDMGNDERGFIPATVKMTPDDEDEGTYKIIGTSQIFTLAGALKGDYKFSGDELIMTGVDGEEHKDSFGEFSNFIIVWLGKKNLPGMGNITLGVYFIE